MSFSGYFDVATIFDLIFTCTSLAFLIIDPPHKVYTRIELTEELRRLWRLLFFGRHRLSFHVLRSQHEKQRRKGKSCYYIIIILLLLTQPYQVGIVHYSSDVFAHAGVKMRINWRDIR